MQVENSTQPEDMDQIVHIDDEFVLPCDDISNMATSVYGEIHERYDNCDLIVRMIIKNQNLHSHQFRN